MPTGGRGSTDRGSIPTRSLQRPWTTLPVPHTTADFRQEEAAAARGLPYLRVRTPTGMLCHSLDPELRSIDLGRNAGNAICLEFDTSVSGRHARLIHGAGVWSVQDICSTNGTLLNGRPLLGERRLRNGAEIVFGATVVTFHDATPHTQSTANQAPTSRRLFPSTTQRKVLVELARPWFTPGNSTGVTPSNPVLAERLGYAPSTVRDAVSDLYKMAGLGRSSGNQREALVRLALDERVVTSLDYGDMPVVNVLADAAEPRP